METTANAVPSWVHKLLRHRLVIVALVALVPTLWRVVGAPDPSDWRYFAFGAQVLSGGVSEVAPLSLYRDHPEVQIGPLALLVSLPFSGLPLSWGAGVVAVLLTLVLPTCCWLLERTACGTADVSLAVQARTAIGGCLAGVYWWAVAADYPHPDDVLVVLAACGALWAVRTDRASLAACLVAAAVACKPWAVALAPLLLALPAPGRWKAVVTAPVLAALPWLPFVLAVPGTLDSLSHFRLDVWEASPLALLGLEHSQPIPGWLRTAQLAFAAALTCGAVARGRWPLALMAVIAGRLALDPQGLDYYFASFVVAALAADVLCGRGPVPWLTAATALITFDARWAITSPTGDAALQLVPLVLFLIALWRPDHVPASRVPRPRSGADLGVRGLQHGGVGPLQPRRAADAVQDHEPQERPA
ncbi:hypothetical protein [Kineococcus sp. SYSU DK004]|uniref:hypothetical protein n=1 Tax=Kineococcus sp. SYSU DK004 TaxID=3383125 RepID=UPI003D7D0224